MKTAPSLLKALLVCFVLIVAATACCKHQNEPDPLPPTEKDTQRGFSQKTEDVVVEMPEEVVYVKEDVNKTLQSYNAETGTISFSNSEELERQNIKAGDILYSAQRTEIAPDGYSLRVTGVSRQGNTVTYQTEPASVLEVFDHLEETGTLKVGDLKPEDIKVYSLIARGGEDPKTKSLDISTEFGIENFSSTWDETSFDWVFYRQYCSSNPNKVAYEAKLKFILQHEFYEDKSTVLIDVGHIVLFSMIKMGVTAVVTLETGDDLSETETAIEWKNVQNNLVDKKYDLLIMPIVLGFANLAVNPSIVCTFQFGLGASGNLTFEAGFKDQVMAFNVENVGYFMPEFLKNSYIRSVSNGHPEMRMKAEAEVSAYASVGPGLRIEIPALQIKEDGEWQSSYVGAYVLGTLRGHANVNVEMDPLSGGLSINSYGDGEAALELALQGKIGFNKLTTGDIDLRIDVLSKKLGEWSWSYFMESPTPYNLNTKIDGNKATFSWDSRPTGMMSPVYDIYLDVGEGYVLYQSAWKQKSFVYTSEKDGVYRWKVVARTANGREYPCAQEQEFTILGNTTLNTLEPEIDVRQRKVVVPVSFSTKNKVKNYGVAFCDNEDFSGGWEEEPGTGIGYKFSVERHVPNHTTLYARGYLMVELEGNTSDSNQYHKFYGNVVKIVVDEEDAKALIRVSEDSAPFGEVEVGKTATLTRTVYNDGTADLVISSVTCSAEAFTPSWRSTTIKPGKSQDITITFKPTEAKRYSSKMEFTCNADNAGDVVITVSGTGVSSAEAKLKVSRTYLEFEDTQVGQSSQLEWTITNVGNAKLTVSSLTAPEGFSTDFSSWSSKSLGPNESHTFNVTFKPTEAKDYSGKMVLDSNASNNQNASFTIGGKGVAAAGEPKIGISPTSVQFGEVTVNTTAESEITITNKGDAPLVFSSISNQDAFTTDFGSWSSKTLEAGQSRKLKVFFKPAAARSYSASISIKTNASNAPDVALPVSGTGVAGAKISTSSTIIEFPTTLTGLIEEVYWIIYNTGTDWLEVSSVTVPNGFSTDFSEWSPKRVAPGREHWFKVRFTPSQAKSYSGKLVIKSNAVNAPEASFVIQGKGATASYPTPKKVDLGLSVKWATFNLGAQTASGSGYLFTWGDPEPKTKYYGDQLWSLYKWCKGEEGTLTKYCNDSSWGYNGYTDDLTVLVPQDDAAHVHLGDGWRIPTNEEWAELRNNCDWKWVTVSGVEGYKVSNKKNPSLYIFLPAMHYWSSSLGKSAPCYAFNAWYTSEYIQWSQHGRYMLDVIRPVCE